MNHPFETYEKSMMPHIHHSYKIAYDISIGKFVHIHHPNMHCLTGNICFVLVPSYYILIFQAKNQIGIIPTHVLQYAFIFIIFFNIAQCIDDVHWTRRIFLVVFSLSCFCDTSRTIHRKRVFYYGDKYC